MGRGANPVAPAKIRFWQNFQKMHEIDKLLVRWGRGGTIIYRCTPQIRKCKLLPLSFTELRYNWVPHAHSNFFFHFHFHAVFDKDYGKQESIPVRSVPSAAVAVCQGGSVADPGGGRGGHGPPWPCKNRS